MTPQETLELSDLNLAESTREMARWRAASKIRESQDLLMTAGPDAFPVGFANAALCLGPRPPSDPEGALREAAAFFAARGRGFTMWIRRHLDGELEAACRAAGLRQVGDAPGMVLDGPLPDAALPEGIDFELATRVEQVRGFASAVTRAYASMGLPLEASRSVFAQPERLLGPQVIAVLASENGSPCSAAMAILSHGIGGLYWVGTPPEARKRGLGEACTRLVGNRAFERGARCVVLQASAEGEPIYRRMGYREVTRYTWWLWLPKGEETRA